jgi:hypothetical protein
VGSDLKMEAVILGPVKNYSSNKNMYLYKHGKSRDTSVVSRWATSGMMGGFDSQ